MSVDLLPQALALAAVGMVTVFVLLVVLIVGTTVMSRLVDPRRQFEQPAQAREDTDAQAEMAAAVAAAIRHHRARAAGAAATAP